ncbi:MAG: hypothetical protein KDE05_13670 [Parvularculaceae bacterium]|nr:hypothetical protein [Parvularculaceae bacterium]
MIAPLLRSVFKKDQARSQAETLYAALADQARAPQFYISAGAPDTVEGRFDVLSLHMALALERLREEGDASARLTQRLQEIFFERLDSALREMGVGDLSVGRKIRGLAEAFYGRYAAYRAGLAENGDALATALARNILGSDRPEKARALTLYMRAAHDALKRASIDDLPSAVGDLRALSRAIGKDESQGDRS